MVSGIYGLGGLAAGGESDQEATLHEHPVASTMCRATSFTRFDDDRILAWVIFLCFHAFESHWLHTTVLKRGGAPYFSGLDPSELLPKQKNAGTIGSNGSEVGPDSDAGVRV